jgi:excisionase family DNA binding protein
MDTVSPRMLTIPQAAAYVGASVKFIRSLIWKRELRYIKAGKRFVIDRAELDRWLDANQRVA